jgi:hypothetical protein
VHRTKGQEAETLKRRNQKGELKRELREFTQIEVAEKVGRVAPRAPLLRLSQFQRTATTAKRGSRWLPLVNSERPCLCLERRPQRPKKTTTASKKKNAGGRNSFCPLDRSCEWASAFTARQPP